MSDAIKKITHNGSLKDLAGASFQYVFCYSLGSVPFPSNGSRLRITAKVMVLAANPVT